MYQPVQNPWWLFRMNPGQEGWDHKPCNNQNISTSLAWYSKIASKLTNPLYSPCSSRAQQRQWSSVICRGMSRSAPSASFLLLGGTWERHVPELGIRVSLILSSSRFLTTRVAPRASQPLSNAANALFEMGKNGNMGRLELSFHPEIETSMFKRWLSICQYWLFSIRFSNGFKIKNYFSRTNQKKPASTIIWSAEQVSDTTFTFCHGCTRSCVSLR